MEQEIKDYIDGKFKDLRFQIKDIRDNTSPFNIEQLKNQIAGLDTRTFSLNDKMIMLNEKINALAQAVEGILKLEEQLEETITKTSDNGKGNKTRSYRRRKK